MFCEAGQVFRVLVLECPIPSVGFHSIKVHKDRAVVCEQDICRLQVAVTDSMLRQPSKQFLELLSHGRALPAGDALVLQKIRKGSALNEFGNKIGFVYERPVEFFDIGQGFGCGDVQHLQAMCL